MQPGISECRYIILLMLLLMAEKIKAELLSN